jgi:hypothetical protein
MQAVRQRKAREAAVSIENKEQKLKKERDRAIKN